MYKEVHDDDGVIGFNLVLRRRVSDVLEVSGIRLKYPIFRCIILLDCNR